MENFINEVTMLSTVISLLAFVVSVITQVTKELYFLSKIPTSLQVIVLSVILTPASYIAYAQYIYMQIHWYMIVASIIAGFFVAFISMFGWDKLSEIYNRIKR